MAGQGRAPKPREQRRNRTEPTRGEWVALPSEFVATMPADPPMVGKTGRRKPHRRTVAAWAAWRADPASSQYGPAELEQVTELALVHDAYWTTGDIRLLSEMRQREDRLGLNPKGKRDLRWIAPTERGTVAGDDRERPVAEVRKLRAVDASG
jgi:hypothetical protein